MSRIQPVPPSLVLVALTGMAAAALAQEAAPPVPAPSAPTPSAPAPSTPDTAVPAPAATAEPAVGRGRIRGVVTDTGKQPVGGRLVVLVSRAEGDALRVTSTDEKGRYQFRDLAPGLYEVRLEAEGFAPETKKDIEVRPPFQNVVDVTLRRAAPSGAPGPAPGTATAPAAAAGGSEIVQGMLRDNGGSPVVEAEVILAPLADGALRQGTSDEKGSFRIEGVAPGAYRLIVRSLGHVPVDVSRVEVAAGSGLTVRLSLVDYALDFVTGKDLRQVQERPRPRPATAAAPAVPAAPGSHPPMKAIAPEPEPEPLVPPPPEEKSTTPPPADPGPPSS